MTMATPAPDYATYYARRLARSLSRHSTAQSLPTTRFAVEFFSSPDPLSHRILSLAQQLDDEECHRIALAAAVFARAPSSFLEECRSLFEEMLEARHEKWQLVRDDATDDESDSQEQLYDALSKLGWVANQLRTPLHSSLHNVTQRVVRSLLTSNFETEGMLTTCLEWKDSVLSPWVKSIVSPLQHTADRWEDRLQYLVYESFIQARSTELFELVTEYPDSLPAVKELSLALHGTGRVFYTFLAKEWRNALVKRLIHPGAQTNQIIDVYISTIRVLREMDSSGELLQVVTRPVREYLRGREDTVRCIISSLTDEESGGELYEELRRQDVKPLEEAQLDEEEDEEMPTFDWMPPPSILQRRGVISGKIGEVGSSSRRAGDILSMLIGIYGSKELFVNEYRIMLADKLLSNLEYDTDAEVHNLELLKLRFGEASMRQCEVMIKDIDDSKRIHSNICSTLEAKAAKGEAPVVDAAIVSHIFWPALQKEEFNNHDRIQSQLDSFGEEYGKLKNPRRLMWMKQLGHVELEVEVYEMDEDGNVVSHVKEVKCTPAHATLLAHFEDKTHWTVEELATETEMPDEMVQKRMNFWISQRVIQQTRSGYSLISVHEANSAEHSFAHDDDDHREHTVSFGSDQEEEIKVYESYIVGMLSNLGELRLEKIHSMLKTFVAGSDHKYDKTPSQLAVFLQQLCKEEKLECSPDGLYKLLKKRS